MSEAIQKITQPLPSLDELRNEVGTEVLAKENALNVLLNQQPPDSWLREHPYAKRKVLRDGKKMDVPALYLPIGRQEWLMSRIFIKWWVEVKECQLIANAVSATVRVHYQNPIDGEMLWMDGVGAVALQVDKDAGAADFNRIKSSAVQMALPAAKSYAFKDAVETIGNLFGKDINRLDDIDYIGLLSQLPIIIDAEELSELESEIATSKLDRAALLEFLKTSYNISELSELPKSLIQTVRMRIISSNNHNGNS